MKTGNSPERQRAAVHEYLTTERTGKEIAFEYGVKLRAFRKWVRRWRGEFEGLTPADTTPKIRPSE